MTTIIVFERLAVDVLYLPLDICVALGLRVVVWGFVTLRFVALGFAKKLIMLSAMISCIA